MQDTYCFGHYVRAMHFESVYSVALECSISKLAHTQPEIYTGKLEKYPDAFD